jgi:Fe-S-cluster containining protein
MPHMGQPWYDSGLRFCCTQCGACCTGSAGYVWVNQEEIARIAEYRDEPVEEFRQLHVRRVGNRLSLREKANGDCVFYDRQKGCTIYPERPRQCRSWPFWESNVATPDDWRRTCHECPGAGQGELFSPEEIVKNLKLVRL